MNNIINQLFIELNDQTDTETAPKWIELLPAGKVVSGIDGRTFLNSSPEALVATFNLQARPIPLDYDHGTELLSRGNSAPAAGWIEEFKLDNGAILGRVDWTPKGAEMVQAREYRYISPALNCQGADRKVMRISSVALTNRPNFTSLASLNNEQEKEEVMTKSIAAKLGLNPEASEEAIYAEIDKLQISLNSDQTPDPNKYVKKDDYDLVLGRAEKAEKELNSTNEENLKADAEAVINEAIKAGKITPASKDHYMELCHSQKGLESVQKALGVSPKAVATKPDETLEEKTERNNHGLTDEQVELCTEMGVEQEEYAKNLK